jgi:hypothetical protein
MRIGIGTAAGSAKAEAEVASIPAMDARTSALGLMFTLNSTAFTLNTTAPPEKPSRRCATAKPIDADAHSPGVTHYDPACLKEDLIRVRVWDGFGRCSGAR